MLIKIITKATSFQNALKNVNKFSERADIAATP